MKHKMKKQDIALKTEPVMVHLEALRKMIIGCLLAIIAGAVVCYEFFESDFMEIAMKPLAGMDPEIIYTSVSESFTTEMLVALLAGTVLTTPITFGLIWHFISPAFFRKERVRVAAYTLTAVILFSAGVCFGYFVMMPFSLDFLLNVSSIEASAMLSVRGYVGFLCKMLASFGLVFEIPLVILFIVRFDIMSVKTLGKIRKYVLLASFCIAAVITPPDVVSQIYVAVPMYLMYELGILAGRIQIHINRMSVKRKQKRRLRKEEKNGAKRNKNDKAELC